MSRILSFKSKAPHPHWLKAEVQQRQIVNELQGILESWSYIPLGIQSHLKFNKVENMPQLFSQEDLPLRCWHQSLNDDSPQMGAYLIGEETPEAQAEVIALSVEVLKQNKLKHLTLTLGNSLFCKGFSEGVPADQVESQLSMLKGPERILRTAERLSDHDFCKKSIEQLRELTKKIRGFGVKELIRYDMGLFHNFAKTKGQTVREEGPMLFRCEWGPDYKPLIVGGQHLVKAPDQKKISVLGFTLKIKELYQNMSQHELSKDFFVSDFLVVSRKKKLRSTVEIVKVLREQGYSVAMDYSEKSKEDLLKHARRMGTLNLLIVGDSESERSEVTLVDVLDTLSMKVKISDVFDATSGFRKILRYQKKMELGI